MNQKLAEMKKRLELSRLQQQGAPQEPKDTAVPTPDPILTPPPSPLAE
jgi:hypothetical protein